MFKIIIASLLLVSAAAQAETIIARSESGDLHAVLRETSAQYTINKGAWVKCNNAAFTGNEDSTLMVYFCEDESTLIVTTYTDPATTPIALVTDEKQHKIHASPLTKFGTAE